MSSENIRALYDAFRKGERPEIGQILITTGVRELVAAWPLGVAVVYEQLRSFDNFTADNDPHGEHDIGSFEHVGETLFWKIDYYAKDLQSGS